MSAEPPVIFAKAFGNSPADLGQVTQEVVRFLEANGVRGRALYAANLAIEELGTNLLKFAYDDTAPHQILLRVEIWPNRLLLVIEDDGHEFDPLNVPAPDVNLPAEQRQPGGLGIYLVRKFAEEMHYERREGRNRLTIVIRC